MGHGSDVASARACDHSPTVADRRFDFALWIFDLALPHSDDRKPPHFRLPNFDSASDSASDSLAPAEAAVTILGGHRRSGYGGPTSKAVTMRGRIHGYTFQDQARRSATPASRATAPGSGAEESPAKRDGESQVMFETG